MMMMMMMMILMMVLFQAQYGAASAPLGDYSADSGLGGYEEARRAARRGRRLNQRQGRRLG